MANADWDLGQKLIVQGACSMDQIREVLSLHDRMRKMGAIPKPFVRVLLEKGYARRDQLMKAGVREADLPQPVEEKPAATPVAPRSRTPLYVGAGILALVAALVLFARGGTRTPVTPGPERPPAVSDAERDANAKGHLDQIAAVAAKGSEFENAPEVVTRLEAFIKAQAGRKWEAEAKQRLKEYRERADVFAKGELEELHTAEAPLREQKRWMDLLALYRKFPPRFLETTDSGRAVQERRREVSRQLVWPE